MENTSQHSSINGKRKQNIPVKQELVVQLRLLWSGMYQILNNLPYKCDCSAEKDQHPLIFLFSQLLADFCYTATFKRVTMQVN